MVARPVAARTGSDSGGSPGGGAASGEMPSGIVASGGAPSGGAPSGGEASRSVTIWEHTFNETLGPGSGLQPGDMETQGAQGFTDGGSWVSTGGWLSKTISTVGYTTVEVEYLLTKDPAYVNSMSVQMVATRGRTY